MLSAIYIYRDTRGNFFTSFLLVEYIILLSPIMERAWKIYLLSRGRRKYEMGIENTRYIFP